MEMKFNFNNMKEKAAFYEPEKSQEIGIILDFFFFGFYLVLNIFKNEFRIIMLSAQFG